MPQRTLVRSSFVTEGYFQSESHDNIRHEYMYLAPPPALFNNRQTGACLCAR